MDNSNDLLVNAQLFSEIACMDGRLFGVSTSCDSCDLAVNSCLRGQVYEALLAANRRAESDLGYDLTPRYHVEDIEIRGAGPRTPLRHLVNRPGISGVNVRQSIKPVLTEVPLSPYVQTAAPVSDSGLGFCIVTVDATRVENPDRVIFRDNVGKLYLTAATPGYPKRVWATWQIALSNGIIPPCSTVTTLNVQHCQYMYIDIPGATVCLDCSEVVDPNAKILPVYPGTTEFVPLAKPIQYISGFYRYWFNVWALVDPGFDGDEVDLFHAQFYKLRTILDFACVQEVAAGPDVICPATSTCESTTYAPDPCAIPPIGAKYSVTISDAEKGIVELCANSDPCPGCFDSSDTVTIRLYYKTDPAALGITLDLPNIATGVAYLAAANLPPSFCGCEIKTGFIAEAQKVQADAKINPVSGETLFVVKFGHTFGHYMYAERIASAPKYSKVRYL